MTTTNTEQTTLMTGTDDTATDDQSQNASTEGKQEPKADAGAKNLEDGKDDAASKLYEGKDKSAEESKDEQSDDQSDTDKKDEKDEGAPEAYEKFALPEGMEQDEAIIADVSQVSKELGLSQENAQKLVDIGSKFAQKMQADQLEAMTDMRKSWEEDTRNDRELGGDKLNENLATAKRALEVHGTPELTDLLSNSGLGDHPEVIRFFNKVGKGLSEDTPVGKAQGAPTPKKNAGDVLYG